MKRILLRVQGKQCQVNVIDRSFSADSTSFEKKQKKFTSTIKMMSTGSKRSYAIVTSLFILILVDETISICNRTPEGAGAPKSPPDGRFRIRIVGNPDRYVPNEPYTIAIAGIRAHTKATHPFTGFMLAVEKENWNPDNAERGEAGNFHLLGDPHTRISDKCPNVVTQTTISPKSEIQVKWVAPKHGSGCVIFRATVVEHRDVWYMDDGMLSKTFCEDDQDTYDIQPSPIEECCACDEAKYELIFEGHWSRQTHPKDFPTNSWSTKFSDIIGASHTADYRFWEYYQTASDGAMEVAEHGATRKLEGELKSQSEFIRTIIKARGIAHPNVTGKTFAVFRVDKKHHLMSFISKIDPSPDWLVGVSGLDLCVNTNCSWIERKVLNLYPWDAGTNDGPTYISPSQPTLPRDVIRRIKTNSPNDPRSPFYDPAGGEMNPLAKIYITRQRLYEKSCDNLSKEDNSDSSACETGPWSAWSECDNACGKKGKRHRQREYLDPRLARRMGCTRKVTQREVCYGSSRSCDEVEERETETGPECALTQWGSWSSCSVRCGKGVRTRRRSYINKKAKKRCESGVAHRPLLEQNESCMGTDCGGPIQEVIEDNPNCAMTQWSDWSPCSVSCGNGTQERTRYPTNRFGTRSRQISDNFLDNEDPCAEMATREEVTCFQSSCDQPAAPDYCYYPPEPGHCRETIHRWYYEPSVEDCSIFAFGGCGGNKNNFNSREKCLDTCKIENPYDDIPIENLRFEGPLPLDPKVDCEVSDWLYGPCNATCGEGYRVKTRKIVRGPRHGGNPCPRKLVRTEKCTVICESERRNHRRRSEGYHHHHRVTRSYQNQVFAQTPECIYSDWTSWSICTVTCGNGEMVRTRSLLNSELSHKCMDRVERKPCSFMPCLRATPQPSVTYY